MRKLAILLVAVGWLCCSKDLAAQTYVQDVFGVVNGGTPFASITETAGNTLIIVGACATSSCGAGSPVVTDTKGNIWTSNLVTGGNDCSAITSAGSAMWVFAAYNIAGGANVVTVTPTLNTFEGFLVEYSGLKSSAAFDQYACQQQANQNPSTSGNTPATTFATELVVSVIAVTDSTRNAGVGFTRRDTGVNNRFDAFEDKNISSTGVQAGTWATSGTSTAGVVVAAFKSSAANLAANSGGQIVAGPLLPQSTPSTAYPNESGYTITSVAGGANLQTAITGAACGTVLSLAHGGTFTAGATPYTLPNTSCTCHTDPTKWVIIRSDAFVGGSTRGVRVDPSSEYNNLAHITGSDTNYLFQVTNNGTGCYWFGPGLDLTETTNNANSVISWGDGTFSASNYPHDFVVDHNYIHGQATLNIGRCVRFDGNWSVAVDSYFSDCHQVGADAQGIQSDDGFGPFLYQNNFIEGAAENTLFGGSPSQPTVLSADITIKNNHYFKPVAWWHGSSFYEGIHWVIKNSIEFKTAQRVLVTSNVFDTSPSDGQHELEIFNTACSGSNKVVDFVQDVTEYLNIFKNSPSALVFGGCSDPTIQPDHRISFSNNLWQNIDACVWGTCAAERTVQLDPGIGSGLPEFSSYDLWVNHDTFDATNMSTGYLFSGNAGVNLSYGMIFTNSINTTGANGAFFGAVAGAGNAVISNFAPNANYKNNCIYGSGGGVGNLSNFSNTQTPANEAAIFVNPGTDFHVSASSVCHNAASDGTDIGANIDAVNAATSGVVHTLTNVHTVTNVSPSTFTHNGSTSITITGTNFIVNSGTGESGLGIIIGGAGPTSAISTDSCGFLNPGQYTITAFTDTSHFTYTGGCVVVMASPVTVALNDTINKIVNSAGTTGTINRYSPGNACTSISVVSATSITCTTPAATGTVTTGPVSVFVSQFGIPVQSTVFGNYN